MSLRFQHQTLVRASAQLLAVLTFLGVLLLIHHPVASAQDCTPGCAAVIIRNCTWPPIQYHIQFVLCCDGEEVISPIVGAPIGPPPCFVAEWIVPEPCTAIGVWNIIPPPPAGWFYNPATCTLHIP